MPKKVKQRKRRVQPAGAWQFLIRNRLNWLVILVPVALALEYLHADRLWVFIVSAAAIIPLAGLISHSTEQIASHTGPHLGGFLNATFGNAAELIIGLFALRAGLLEVVKASISGSILANILLVLGLSMVVGGIGREKQTFSRTRAGATSAMLMLAVVALVMPAVFDLAVFGSLEALPLQVWELSLLVAGVLILTYAAEIVFSFTRREAPLPAGEEEKPEMTLAAAVGILAVATAFAAWVAEVLVGAIGAATQSLGMSQFFVGIIIVAIVGNGAEHFTAVTVARKNRMDLAVNIATASSIQVALFVAPVLVFASLFFGHHLSLVFNAFEVVSLALAVSVVAVVSLDGESNWLEGVQLVAVYLILAIVFFFVPSGQAMGR